jgi:hypothetical protein
VRWKCVFRHREVDRHEARARAGQTIEQPALVGECLPQCMRQLRMRLILRSARTGIRPGMPHADGIKAVQARLRDDDQPVGMAAPRLLQSAQHRMLNRVCHLHHDQQEV